jgi:hypothetical protein
MDFLILPLIIASQHNKQNNHLMNKRNLGGFGFICPLADVARPAAKNPFPVNDRHKGLTPHARKTD